MKTVCITQMDDGQYSVELEPQEGEGHDDAQMGGEGSPEDMKADEAEGHPAKMCATIQEACDAAAALFGVDEEAGEPAGPMIPGEEEVQASFVDGYKKARGGPGQGF